jgi:hypothetical protein
MISSISCFFTDFICGFDAQNLRTRKFFLGKYVEFASMAGYYCAGVMLFECLL